MNTYRICDLALESNIVLDELPLAAARSPQLSFRYQSDHLPLKREPDRMFRSCTRNGRIWMDVGRIDGEQLLRFPGLGDFRLSADGRSIAGFSQAGTPLHTIRHLLLDQVLPLVLSSQSDLVLHAGAVETQHGAAAFVGESGSGKSTLTASLARAGHTLISDDFLVLRARGERWLAHPSYPGLRLWSDSAETLFGSGDSGSAVAHYTPKRRCGTDGGALPFAIEPSVLERVYVLTPAVSERIVITSLSPREAFVELIQHCYRLEIDDREFLSRQFAALTRLADRPIFKRLSFPRRYSMLAATGRAIQADLGYRSASP